LPPFDNYEAYVDQCPVTCCSRLSWRWCSPGLTTVQRLLLVCRSSSWIGFSLCRTPLHGWFSELVDIRPRAASVVELTLASGSWTDLVPAGSASVSLSPRLCTWLHGVRSSARLRPRRPSATAFVVYVSACCSTYRACYHRRPSLPGGCCFCLEQSAGDSTIIAVIASFLQ